MKKINQPFETGQHDLAGYDAIDFYDKENFNSFAFKLTNYNPDRYEPVALRIFVQTGNPVITLFAVDKFKRKQSNYPKDKLPVKKFKLLLTWEEFTRNIKRCDLTVSNNAFDIKDMRVLNK